MSGEDVGGEAGEVAGHLVLLEDGPAGQIADFVTTLRRLPADPPWILVGGLAVNATVGRNHRATNDIDTVTPDQDRLVSILVALPDADPLSAAKVQLHHPEVEVDVMDSTERKPLPADPRERAFALARRFAMQSASPLTLGAVSPDGTVTSKVAVPVATRAALVVLKTLSFPERIDGSYRAKVGSDIQDLYRLVERTDLDRLAEDVLAAGPELAEFVGAELVHYFSAGTADLRYAHTRMRSFARNVDAAGISEEALATLGVLGEVIGDGVEHAG